MESSCNQNTKPKNLREFIRLYRKTLIATAIGAAAGYAYYYFIGCSSGSCAISSNPWISTAWGGLLGYFLVSSPCRTC